MLPLAANNFYILSFIYTTIMVNPEKEVYPLHHRIKWLKRLILVAVIVAVYIVLYTSPFLRKILFDPSQLNLYVVALGVAAPLVIIFLQALQNIISIFSSEVVSVLAGFLFGPFWGFIYSFVGATLGSVAVFLLSRKYGKELAVKLFHKKDLVHYYKLHQQGEFWAVFLIRVAPLFPNELVSFGAGMTNIKFSRFLIASSLGFVTEMLILTYFGAELSKGMISTKLVLIGIILMAFIGIVLFREKIKKFLIKDFHKLEKEGKVIETEIEREFKKI